MRPAPVVRSVMLAALLMTCIGAPALAQSAGAISAIDVEEGSDATVLTIVGETELTWSVFTLRNPERLFVDISNAQPIGVPAALTIDNGVVSEVTVDAYRDADIDVTRIVVGLERETYYDVMNDGTSLVVVLDATRRAESVTVGERVRYSDPAVATARDDADAWRDRAAELESELAALRAEAERASDLEAELAALRESERRVAELEAELEAAQQRAEDARARADEAERANDEVAAERARAEALEAELAVSQARLEEVDEARRQLIAASEADDVDERLAALEAELAARDAALADLRAAGDAAGQRDEIQASLDRAQQALEQTRAELAATDDRAARAEETAQARAERIAELEAELERARIAEQERARWEARARELEAELAQREAELSRREAQDGASALMGSGPRDVSVPDADRATPGLPTVRVAPAAPTPSGWTRPSPDTNAPRPPGQLADEGETQDEDDDDERNERRCRAVGSEFGGTSRTRWVPCP